jgi:hypothetical protein
MEALMANHWTRAQRDLFDEMPAIALDGSDGNDGMPAGSGAMTKITPDRLARNAGWSLQSKIDHP